MRRALPFFACLCFMALVSSSARASFDSAGQPSLAKAEPVSANAPVSRLTQVQLNGLAQLWSVTVVRVRPVKMVFAIQPPPAKKPVRPRPLTK
jgi:hypothetical protein